MSKSEKTLLSSGYKPEKTKAYIQNSYRKDRIIAEVFIGYKREFITLSCRNRTIDFHPFHQNALKIAEKVLMDDLSHKLYNSISEIRGQPYY